MREPNKKIPVEIFESSLGYNSITILSAYGGPDREKDIDDYGQHPSEPLFRLSEVPLPAGVELKDCYIAMYGDDNGHYIVRLMHDKEDNPQYTEQLKEYELWNQEQEILEKKRLMEEKSRLESQIKNLKEELKQYK